MIATALLLVLTAQGCASWPTPDVPHDSLATHEVDSQTIPPEILATPLPREIVSSASQSSSQSAGIEHDWSSRTRAGREAIVALDYSAAETLLFEAFQASTRFRSSDVRIDVSLGNLIRLASIYEDLDRPDDSKRILSGVEKVADVHDITRQRIEKHRARYLEAKATTLRPYDRKARRARERRMRTRASAPFDDLIRHAAISYDVDPALIKAVVAAESNFEPKAVSRVGAQGLMQLMPDTARAMGVRRPFVPRENIRGGVRYLRSLLDRFDDLDHVLAAYNAGPDAVLRYGGVPPYPETEEYVARVRSNYRRYQDSAAH